MGLSAFRVAPVIALAFQIKTACSQHCSSTDGEPSESCRRAEVVGPESDSDSVNLLAHRVQSSQTRSQGVVAPGSPASRVGVQSERHAKANKYNVPVMHIGFSDKGFGVYMDIVIGTPPQIVSVLLDTGSSTLAVPGDFSHGRDFPHCDGDMRSYIMQGCCVGGYDPIMSSSAAFWSDESPGCKNPWGGSVGKGFSACVFKICYGDGSCTTGAIVNDTVALGSLPGTVSFGSITNMSKGFQEPPAAGIMGLSNELGNCLPGPGKEKICRPPAFASVLEANGLDHAFGMCLGEIEAPGVMTLGGADPQFYSGDLYAAPLVMNGTIGKRKWASYYSVRYFGVGVGGLNSSVAPGIGIVDTGDSDSAFTQEMMNAFFDSTLPCTSDGDCVVNIQLDGFCLNIVGMLFCSPVGDSGGFCTPNVTFSAFGENESVSLKPGIQDFFIIGYSMLRDMYTVFDQTSHTVSFANRSEVPCQVPCPSYITQEACQMAEGCRWASDECSGTARGGTTAGGSTVTPGACFP